MNTPEEALEEIDYVTAQLGMKVIMLGSMIKRPIPAAVEHYPGTEELLTWRDVLGAGQRIRLRPGLGNVR